MSKQFSDDVSRIIDQLTDILSETGEGLPACMSKLSGKCKCTGDSTCDCKDSDKTVDAMEGIFTKLSIDEVDFFDGFSTLLSTILSSISPTDEKTEKSECCKASSGGGDCKCAKSTEIPEVQNMLRSVMSIIDDLDRAKNACYVDPDSQGNTQARLRSVVEGLELIQTKIAKLGISVGSML